MIIHLEVLDCSALEVDVHAASRQQEGQPTTEPLGHSRGSCRSLRCHKLCIRWNIQHVQGERKSQAGLGLGTGAPKPELALCPSTRMSTVQRPPEKRKKSFKCHTIYKQNFCSSTEVSMAPQRLTRQEFGGNKICNCTQDCQLKARGAN